MSSCTGIRLRKRGRLHQVLHSLVRVASLGLAGVTRDALKKSGTPEQVRKLTEGVRAGPKAICDAPGTYVKVRSD